VGVVGVAGLSACHARPPASAVRASASWPGADVVDADTALAVPLERAAQGALGVADTYAIVDEHGVTVLATLTRDARPLASADDVRQSIARVLAQLPPDASPPSVERVDPSSAPVLRFRAVDTAEALPDATAALEAAARALETVPGVVRVEIAHGAHKEIDVRVDGARAAAMGLSAVDVATILAKETLGADANLAVAAIGLASLRTAAPAVHVSDVALVSLEGVSDDAAFARTSTSTSPSPRPPLTLTVVKQGGAHTADVERDVLKTLAQVSLPASLTLTREPIADDAAQNAVIISDADASVVERVAGQIRSSLGVGAPASAPVQNRVEVDRARAAELGVDASAVAQALQLALAGRVVAHLDVAGSFAGGIPVRVSQPVDEHAPLAAQLRVAGRDGAVVPLSSVVTETLAQKPTRLVRKNGVPSVAVCVPRGPGAVDVDSRLLDLQLPPGATVSVARDPLVTHLLCDTSPRTAP
ncbi:MAG TPA: efflux RND transporter permease subunit, partial [Myxococcota bacterium]